MNFPLFIARRIYSGKEDKRKVSRPAIRIAMLGVAIGLAVMIVTVSVVLGFKHTIRDKVIGFGSHIQIESLMAVGNQVELSDSTMDILSHMAGIGHIQRFAMAQGILKTDSDFLGVAFKGIDEQYQTDFISQHVIDGKMPAFHAAESTNSIAISKVIADKLQLKADDRVFAYFITDDGVKARKFTVAAVYQTNMNKFDQALCFTDLYTTRKLSGTDTTDIYSGAEMTVDNFELLDPIATDVAEQLKIINSEIEEPYYTLASKTIFEAYPQIFSWLQLLDINVWIILVLMVCVAGFTMISGLLIIIIERTSMIGTLKSMGAKNKTIRHTFLWFAVFIIAKGMLIGNLLGLGICLLQRFTGLVKLDAETYYVDVVPIEINIPAIVLINLGTLLISVAVLIAPSYLISHIQPAKSIKYE